MGNAINFKLRGLSAAAPEIYRARGFQRPRWFRTGKTKSFPWRETSEPGAVCYVRSNRGLLADISDIYEYVYVYPDFNAKVQKHKSTDSKDNERFIKI